MSARDSRLAQSQEVFRNANERLQRAVAGKVGAEDPIPFICECADEDCMDTVPLTRDLYAEVRAHPDRFLIVRGHPMIPGERVVQNGHGYSIAEKGHDE